MRTRVVSVLALASVSILGSFCGGSTTSDISSGSGSGSDAASDAPPTPGTDSDGGGDATADGATDGGPACVPACGQGRLCCKGTCINPDNDPKNCGACGVSCSGNTPYCSGTCLPLPCSLGGGACNGGRTCCGSNCCDPGALCCKTEGPLAGPPVCVTPTAGQPTCPQGCAPLCVSDRDAKRDIAPIDERAVLDAVGRMPISTWSYKTDPAGVRHLGPMAQDFYGTLGVGASARAYDPIDAHGAAFASIKALYTIVQEQGARLEQLERENRALRSRSGDAAECRP